MITKKEIIFTFILATNLFLLSFFFSRNWVSDNFLSSRIYGFPLPIVSIEKSAINFEEASKVYSLHNYELLNQGWDFKFGSDKINFFFSLLLNFLFYLVASSIFVGSFNAFIFMLVRRIGSGRERFY